MKRGEKMKWFSRLFGGAWGDRPRQSGKTGAAEGVQPPEETKKASVPPRNEGPYLTQTVVFGAHLYRQPGEDSSVYFVDEKQGIRKMLINEDGLIQNCPGFVEEDCWVKALSSQTVGSRIHFRTSFEPRVGRWIMLWQIQPDGRYWEDEDGFGGESDPEITLYTYVDLQGEFTGPFRIYRLGRREFTVDRFESVQRWCYEKALRQIHGGKKDGSWVDTVFPRLRVQHRHFGPDLCKIRDLEEARLYWMDPLLSSRLVEASEALLGRDAPLSEFLGEADCAEVRACMTLFYLVTRKPVFSKVLDKFFGGEMDERTVKALDGLLEG